MKSTCTQKHLLRWISPPFDKPSKLQTLTLSLLLRFAETILALKKWQKCLPNSQPSTRLHAWLAKAHQGFLSLLPIYFDRVLAFANPLYGFDPAFLNKNKEPASDLEERMLDFLRRQEKLGGPATAICLVLDAATTNVEMIEQGYRVAGSRSLDNSDSNDTYHALQRQWPAIYARSTINLSAATNALVSTAAHSSGSGIRGSWALDSPRVVKKSTNTEWTVLEYGPDVGKAASFPHSEWQTLTDILGSEKNFNSNGLPPREASGSSKRYQAISFHEELSVPDDGSVGLTALGDPLFRGSHHNRGLPSSFPDRLPKSSFYTVPVNESVSMVVVVKPEKENRWHRKWGRIADEDVLEFLESTALLLRVSTVFSRNIPPSPSPSTSLLVSPRAEATLWDEVTLRRLLHSIKRSFDLRSVPTHDTLRSSLARSNSPAPSNVRFVDLPGGRPHQREVSNAKSAAILFLGPDLAQILDP